MSFPLQIFLLVCADRLEGNKFVETVENCVAFGAPGDRVNGSVDLDEVGSEVSVFGPYFD